MFCQNCGKEIPANVKFCNHCGAEQKDITSQSSPKVNQNMSGSVSYSGYQTEERSTYAPVRHLKTDRSLLKFILLSIITFGIYGIIVMSEISTDINTIASKYDGRKTMHYCWVIFLFSWLTYGIVPLVWSHNISGRIGAELKRRGISYEFGSGTFWGWSILGALIVVGPFIYCYKLLEAMNLLCEDYNRKG
ncbi:MAG: DUF4234 domain-containing protein [Marvinbryantia sp.]|jgi:hypothetical protein